MATMKWISLEDANGNTIGTFTPQVNKQKKRMEMYLTLANEPTPAEADGLDKMGFHRVKTRTPAGNIIFGSVKFCHPDDPAKLSIGQQVENIRNTWPHTRFGVEMDRQKDVFNFDYGLSVKAPRASASAPKSNQAAQTSANRSTQSTASGKAPAASVTKEINFDVNQAVLLGYNDSEQAVFEFNGERFIETNPDEYLSERDQSWAVRGPRPEYLRASFHAFESDAERIGKAIFHHSRKKPDFSRQDLNNYLRAVYTGNIADSMTTGELVAAVNRGIKRTLLDAQPNIIPDTLDSYESIEPVDDYMRRLPGSDTMLLTQPSVQAHAAKIIQGLEIGGDGKTLRVTVAHSGDGFLPRAMQESFPDSSIRLIGPDAPASSPRQKVHKLNAMSLLNADIKNIREVKHELTRDRLPDNSADIMAAVFPSGTISQATNGDKESVNFDGFSTERYEHVAALNALHGLSDRGVAFLTLASHGDEVDRQFLTRIAQQYTIHGVTRLSGDASTNGQDTLVLFAGDKEFVLNQDHTFDSDIPTKITPDEAFSWMQVAGNRIESHLFERGQRDKPASALSSISSQSISDIANRATQNDRFVAVNENEITVNPITGPSKADRPLVIAKELQRAVAEANAVLVKSIRSQGFANPTEFLADRLGYPIEDLQNEKLLNKYQQDNVIRAIHRHETQGAPFMIGDGTGVGKTRQQAAIAKYYLERGQGIVFSSASTEIFNKFMVEMEVLGADHLVEPFVLNHDFKLRNSHGDVLTRGDNGINKRLQQSGGVMPGNVLFFTPNQISREVKRKKGESLADFNIRQEQSKQALVRRTVEQRPFVGLIDESHKYAGASSYSGEVLRELLPRLENSLFTSATAIPNKNSYGLYREVLPGQIDPNDLSEAIKAGGNTVTQAITIGLIRTGAYSTSHFPTQVDVELARPFDDQTEKFNVATVNTLAPLFDYYTSLTGEVQGALTDEVEAENKRIRGAGDNSGINEAGSPRDLGFDTSHFGSATSNMIDATVLLLTARQAVPYVKREVDAGRKVVLTLQNTGSAMIEKLRKEGKVNPDGSMPVPTLRDIANHLLDSAEYIKHVDPKTGKEVILNAVDKLTGQRKTDFIAHMRAAREYVDTKVPALPYAPIDQMRHELSQLGLNVGEVSGRQERAEFIDEQTINMVPRPAAEVDKHHLLSDYRKGAYHAVVLTKAGATGLDFHTDINDAVKQPVSMINVQYQSSGTDQVQMYGRVDRNGIPDNMRPTVIAMLTGVPAHTRKIEQSSIATANVMAASKGSVNVGIKAASNEDGVNLMGAAGNRAILRYLIRNPDLARQLLMFNEVEPYLNNEDKQITYNAYNTKLADRFLSRLMMIDQGKAQNVINSIIRETVALTKEDAILGRNDTGSARFMDVKGTEVKRHTVSVSAHPGADPEHPFLGDVVVKEIQYDESISPLQPDDVVELIEVGEERYTGSTIVSEGKLAQSLKDLKANKLALLMNALPDNELIKARYAPDEATRDSVVSKFIDKNPLSTVARLNNEIDWIARNAKIIKPGSVINKLRFSSHDLGLYGTHNAVVTSVTPPEPGNEHMMSQWQLELAIPGRATPFPMNMGMVYGAYGSGGISLEAFDEDHDMADEFEKHTPRTVERKMLVMSGALIESSLMMAKQGGGTPITYTDDGGNHHFGFMLNKKTTVRDLLRTPQRMSASDAAAFIKDNSRHAISTSSGDHEPTKHVSVAIVGGAITLISPDNRTYGANYARASRVVTDRYGNESTANPLEHITGNSFEAKSRRAILEIPADKLEEVLDYMNTVERGSIYGNEYSLPYMNRVNSTKDDDNTLDDEHNQTNQQKQIA